MEVFIAYYSEDQIPILEQTMLAWAEVEGMEPVGVRCPDGKYEMVRRITADSMATSNRYILADLGCVPSTNKLDLDASNLDDLIGFYRSGTELPFPTGVRICKKDSVRRWVPKRTDSYDEEHAESVRLSGGKVSICRSILYKHLQEC